MMKPLVNKPFGFSEFFNSKIGVGDSSVCVNMIYHAPGGLLPVSCPGALGVIVCLDTIEKANRNYC